MSTDDSPIADRMRCAEEAADNGDLTRAIAEWEAVLRREPRMAIACYKLGNLARQSHQPVAAIARFRQAVELDPGMVPAWNNLGSLLRENGDIAGARVCYSKAAHVQPTDSVVLGNLCGILLQSGALREAIACCQAALAVDPCHVAAHHYLAMVLQTSGQLDDAVHHYEQALALAPENETIRLDLAGALQRQNRLDEAANHFHYVLGQRQDAAAAIRLAIQVTMMPDSQAVIATERQRISDDLNRLSGSGLTLDDPLQRGCTTLFALAYHGLPNRALQEALAAVYLDACPSLAWQAPHESCPTGIGKSDGRIRVGIISRHLRTHTIGKLTHGLIRHLDRDRFHVTVFCLDSLDAHSQAIMADADTAIALQGGLEFMRQEIAKQRLDVLLYPDIGMEPTTYFLAFSRLAPVQCTTWGHPDTTGIPTIDYVLSSNAIEPSQARDHYSEDLVLLNGFPAHAFRPTMPDHLLDRAALGLPEADHLYACVQSLFKLHPDFDGLAAEILRRDRDGRLLLIEGQSRWWTDTWLGRFTRHHGDLADRVTILPRMDETHYFSVLGAVDALLDTPHFNGGQTSLDAMAAGVPLVTLPGEMMRGRTTAGFYGKLGLTDLIANNSATYVDLALRLAHDRDWRLDLQQVIRDNGPQLFEQASGLREIEDFLVQAVASA